ncbi:ABC transporter substrate-binding protein [Deinococcus sonorensis]|uniref:Extracellular solute-binding protein n=2 Tax=Deinococcus sonorensis TaxID=309891 RepID=A0AAU7U5Z4_9DEIO
MKRTLALLTLSALLSAPALAQSGSIRLIAQSTGAGNPPMDALIAAFQKKYPNIKVTAEYFPIGTAYPQVLRTQLQSGNGPDLFYVTAGSGGQVSVLPLADAGFVAPLTARPWSKTAVTVNYRDLYWKQNQLYAVPLGMTPVAAIYNKDLVKTLGITLPRSLGQFLQTCKTVKAKGKVLLALAGGNAQNAGLLLSTIATNEVLSADPQWNAKRQQGKVTFANTSAWKRSLQTLLDMKKAGCFQPGVEGADIPQAAPLMASGDAVMFVIPTGAISALKGINPKLNLGATPLPASTAALASIPVSPTDALAVNKTSKNLPAALAFADFVASGGGDVTYTKATGDITAAQASTGKNLPPELAGISAALTNKSRVFPLIQLDWSNPKVFTTLGEGVQGLLTGQTTPDQLLARLDAAWDSK